MNFPSWRRLVFDTAHQHEYVVEGLLFRRFFWSEEDLTEPLDHDNSALPLLRVLPTDPWQTQQEAGKLYYAEQSHFREEESSIPINRFGSKPDGTSGRAPPAKAPFLSATPRTELFLRHLFHILRLIEMLIVDSSFESIDGCSKGRSHSGVRINWEYALLEALDELHLKNKNRLFDGKYFTQYVDDINRGDFSHDGRRGERDHRRKLELFEPQDYEDE